MSEMLRWFLAALAVYRLAQLFPYDDGPAFVFKRWRALLEAAAQREREATGPDGPLQSLNEGLTCPFCLGVWLAMGVVVLAIFPSRVGDFILAWWGLAGAQAWLQGNR